MTQKEKGIEESKHEDSEDSERKQRRTGKVASMRKLQFA